MNVSQAVPHPFGINVFGSSVVRIEPDIASFKFAVSRLEQHPRDSFASAHKAAKSVREYLTKIGLKDVGFSRMTLAPEFRYTAGEQRFVGYTARVTFHLLLRNLDQMEEVVSGVIDAGTNEINAVDFQTSQLKEIRAEARRRAVEAAREKAENYCQAAGVGLGRVLHIEDVNPDILGGTREGHVLREVQLDDEGPLQAFTPGSITVGAAVMVAFELKQI
jgi:uncharacterized protein